LFTFQEGLFDIEVLVFAEQKIKPKVTDEIALTRGFAEAPNGRNIGEKENDNPLKQGNFTSLAQSPISPSPFYRA